MQACAAFAGDFDGDEINAFVAQVSSSAGAAGVLLTLPLAAAAASFRWGGMLGTPR